MKLSEDSSRDEIPIKEAMLKAFLEAFNRHDLDAIMTFFSDDCTFEMPRGPHPFGEKYVGKQAVREGLASRFRGIPDVHYGDDRHFLSAAGDRGVSEWLLTGTNTAGERIAVRGCDLFELDQSGKIRRKDSYWKIVTNSTLCHTVNGIPDFFESSSECHL